MQEFLNGFCFSLLPLLVILVLSRYAYRYFKYNLPPGPVGLPLIGYLPFLGREIYKDAMNISKRYKADIISFQIGPVKVVALNSLDAIKEAFVKNGDNYAARPNFFVKSFVARNRGIIVTDGPLWVEQRQHALTCLKNLGMGRLSTEEKVLDEITHVLKFIEAKEGVIFDPQYITTTLVSNIICSLIFGQRYEFDDTQFQEILHAINLHVKTFTFANPLNFIPALRHLPGDMFKFKLLLKNIEKIRALVKQQIENHKKRFISGDQRDFIDAYLDAMMNQKIHDAETYFTDDQLFQVIFDLFLAGTETTSTTLRWALVIMVNYPNIQKKVHEEIDEIIGRSCLPRRKDRIKLKYAEAVLMEIQRWASVVPFGVPHTNLKKDTKLLQFDIPKNSFVFANSYAVHHDPSIWKDPHNFCPENFINESGSIINKEYLIPFSIGKRACLGQSLAEMEIFLIFTAFLQHFTIHAKDEINKPSMEPAVGVVRTPKPFEIRLFKRL